MKWSQQRILHRVRETGEHPAEIGKRGGLRTALIRRERKRKEEADKKIQKQWWNQ